MSGFDLTITLMNMVGAIAALACNAWAAAYGSERLRALRIGIALYSGIYVAAYAWLAIVEDVVAWSRVMRGVSLMAWPMVWCAPALAGVRTARRTVAEIEQLGERP